MSMAQPAKTSEGAKKGSVMSQNHPPIVLKSVDMTIIDSGSDFLPTVGLWYMFMLRGRMASTWLRKMLKKRGRRVVKHGILCCALWLTFDKAGCLGVGTSTRNTVNEMASILKQIENGAFNTVGRLSKRRSNEQTVRILLLNTVRRHFYKPLWLSRTFVPFSHRRIDTN